MSPRHLCIGHRWSAVHRPDWDAGVTWTWRV